MGCAIHPFPEDVVGADTPDIVRQIRCEARESIKGIVIGYVNSLARDGDPVALQLAAEYRSDPDAANNFNPSLFQVPGMHRSGTSARSSLGTRPIRSTCRRRKTTILRQTLASYSH